MKGIIFTEFLEMVEEQFGFLVADKIVSSADLPSGGVYTAVGTYPHSEIVSLVVELSKESSIQVPELLQTFGHHVFKKFVVGYGHFFEDVEDPFDFLYSLEGYIHVEVRKLYPDAELPSFDSVRHGHDHLTMEYRSERGMADFALGLIEGCIQHYEQNITVEREDVNPRGSHTIFTLRRSA